MAANKLTIGDDLKKIKYYTQIFGPTQGNSSKIGMKYLADKLWMNINIAQERKTHLYKTSITYR